MSFPEVAGAAVVLIVVVSGMINRARRSARPPGTENAGRAAFEAMVEQRGAAGATTDLRAMLQAARAANQSSGHGPSATIDIETTGGAVDLGELIAAAREIKHSRSESTPVDARALLAAARHLQNAGDVDAPQVRTPHKKQHHDRTDHVSPVAPFDGARPPLGAMPALSPLHAMRAMQPRAPMQPLAAIIAH